MRVPWLFTAVLVGIVLICIGLPVDVIVKPLLWFGSLGLILSVLVGTKALTEKLLTACILLAAFSLTGTLISSALRSAFTTIPQQSGAHGSGFSSLLLVMFLFLCLVVFIVAKIFVLRPEPKKLPRPTLRTPVIAIEPTPVPDFTIETEEAAAKESESTDNDTNDDVNIFSRKETRRGQ